MVKSGDTVPLKGDRDTRLELLEKPYVIEKQIGHPA